MAKKKLGMLLSTPPSHPHARTAVRLCEEALKADLDVYLYVIDEGVKNLSETPLGELSDKGVKCFVCAYGCQQHQVVTQGLKEGIQLCGLVVLSNIINGCDRFLALN